MSASPPPDRKDERLEALEIKASYAEDLLEQLNQLVYQQQRQIDRLTRELAWLQRQSAEPAGSVPFRSLRDELPPHY